jgi:hypothetical protein
MVVPILILDDPVGEIASFLLICFLFLWYYFSKAKYELASLKLLQEFKDRYSEEIPIYMLLLEIYHNNSEDNFLDKIQTQTGKNVTENTLLCIQRIHENQKLNVLDPFFNKLEEDFGPRFGKYKPPKMD